MKYLTVMFCLIFYWRSLKFLVKPEVLIDPPDIFVVENDEVELNWPVMANPAAIISWYWNGDPLDLSLGEFVSMYRSLSAFI